jgi:hypothetical protein
MKLRNILLISLICFLQTSSNAMSNPWAQRHIQQDYSDFLISDSPVATSGFLLGYSTGLIPVAGQVILPFLICNTESLQINPYTFDIFAQSVALGHVAGVATIMSVYSYTCKKMGRKNKIREDQLENGYSDKRKTSFSEKEHLHLN